MKIAILFYTTTAMMLSSVLPSAWAGDTLPPPSPFRDDPKAHALYDRMLDVIRQAETMYYESDYRVELPSLGETHTKYRIWMRKPNYVRIESQEQETKAQGVLAGDGDYFWIYWPTGRPYMPGTDVEEWQRTRNLTYRKIRTPQGLHSIAHSIDELGTGTMMTILEPSIFHGYDDPMQPYLDGVRSLGTELVGEEECDVIEASFMDHQRVRSFWISRRDSLPRKLKEVIRVQFDIIKEETLSNIRLNEKIALNLFTWKPPQDWVEYEPPRIEDRLLKAGSDAPDFCLTSGGGKTLSLSSYRGNFVWLIFWRVGCQGCREGMLYARDMWKKHRKQGLVVLGFNCADKKDIAMRFLRGLSVKFPNIIDSSEQAQKICYAEYQKVGMSAVPLNYLIDREGKVVDAWYGIEENDRHITELLEQVLDK